MYPLTINNRQSKPLASRAFLYFSIPLAASHDWTSVGGVWFVPGVSSFSGERVKEVSMAPVISSNSESIYRR